MAINTPNFIPPSFSSLDILFDLIIVHVTCYIIIIINYPIFSVSKRCNLPLGSTNSEPVVSVFIYTADYAKRKLTCCDYP